MVIVMNLEDIMNLGYSKEEVLKMGENHPTIFNYSIYPKCCYFSMLPKFTNYIWVINRKYKKKNKRYNEFRV